MKFYSVPSPTFLLFILYFSVQMNGRCQQFPLWGKLKPGKYAVGYRDTIITNENSPYKYASYRGAKPFLISIWYPAVTDGTKPFMRFNNYMDFSRFENYKVIIDSLREKYDKIYVRDAIAKNIKEMKPAKVDFGDQQKQIFADLQNVTVNAIRNLKSKRGNFPCIFYHHGAGSTPFDNITFCEYMASNGYVVISSNFLWPEDNYASLGMDDEVNDITFVLSATRSIVNGKISYVTAVGHSWGAQALIMADTLRAKPFRKILALHTTLEDKPVDVAKEYWKGLMGALQTKHQTMTTPTTILAPEFRIKDGFHFLTFKENKTTPYTFVTVKTKYITHDGFITLGNFRAPFAQKYMMDDRQELEMQLDYYCSIVLLTQFMIENDDYNEKKIPSKDRFDIIKYNNKGL